MPAAEILTIAEKVLQGRIAQAEGRYLEAAEILREAVEIEDALPYTEPPYWYYPVRQTLGAVLLQGGEADQAREVFQQALIRSPNNGWALYGLMEAYRALGDDFAASHTRELFEAAWMGEGPPDIGAL